MANRQGLNPYQRGLLAKAMKDIEQMCAKGSTQEWEKHALRGAYFALDAVWRQDSQGVGHALQAIDKSLEVQHGHP